jgi:hypothetical protein
MTHETVIKNHLPEPGFYRSISLSLLCHVWPLPRYVILALKNLLLNASIIKILLSANALTLFCRSCMQSI